MWHLVGTVGWFLNTYVGGYRYGRRSGDGGAGMIGFVPCGIEWSGIFAIRLDSGWFRFFGEGGAVIWCTVLPPLSSR